MIRRAAKLPEMIFVCIAALGIYLYVFINDISSRHGGSAEIYLPAILGAIAGLIALIFTSIKRDLVGGLMFFSALFLVGIYHGISGIFRPVAAALSLVLQIGATVSFVTLYIVKRKKKKERAKVEEDFAKTYSFIFTVLIILTILQLIQLISMLILPLTLFKATPFWIILLGGGAIITTLIATLRKYDVLLLMLLVANIVIFAISFLIEDLLYLALNIILLLLLIGTIFYIVKKHTKI
jgi:hypothetical protein